MESFYAEMRMIRQMCGAILNDELSCV